MYTPPVRRRDKPPPRRAARRRSIVTELPLQPPAETPPPVLMRPAIEAAWRAELAATMASLHPPVNDEMAPTEPTRPLRNAVGSEPTPPSVRIALSKPVLEIIETPPPVVAIEPVADLRPRSARAGIALAVLAVVAVLIGAGVAFFKSDVEVDVRADVAEPPATEPGPAPVVTALAVDEPQPEPEPKPKPAAEPKPEPEPERKTKPKRKAKPKPKPPPAPEPEEFVERVVDEPGFFTVDAHPYATVYIDGERIGDTPLIRHTLSAGKHKIKLVSSDGGTKRFVVRIEPGKTLRRRVGAMK